ncbi:MAG: flap structure-specific endonuclease, partial [Methanogenium sp.]|nr:flap structure-specific endonuclease [Methanogenium sp.]
IGTDFNEGIRGVGAKTALKLVKKGEFVKTIEKKTPEFDPGPVKDFFLNPPHITGYDLKWSSPDENGLYEMLCDMHDFSRNRVQTVLEKMCVCSDQKTLDQWF